MKNLNFALGVLILVLAIAYPVFAWGPGWGMGHHMTGNQEAGSWYCCQGWSGIDTLTDEQRTQLENLHQKFYGETVSLRNEIRTKSEELDSLMATSNPDPEKATALQKDISDLKAKMAEKRVGFEIEARKIAPDARFGERRGRGQGMGYGNRMRGYGPGRCWW